MRHHDKVRKFGRETNQRGALMRSLVRALILEEKMETSLAKAKELRPMIEKVITKSMEKSVANRRLITSRIGSGTHVKKLFEVIAPRYTERKGGYTRIIKLPRRVNDGSFRAQIEFV